MKIKVTNIEFDSMETYIQWKEDIERSTHSRYVLKCAPTISNKQRFGIIIATEQVCINLMVKGSVS